MPTLNINVLSVIGGTVVAAPAAGMATATFQAADGTSSNITVSEDGEITFAGNSGANTDIVFTLHANVTNYGLAFRTDKPAMTYRHAASTTEAVNNSVTVQAGNENWEYTLHLIDNHTAGTTVYWDIDPRVINW